jgi:hypothetical protein
MWGGFHGMVVNNLIWDNNKVSGSVTTSNALTVAGGVAGHIVSGNMIGAASASTGAGIVCWSSFNSIIFGNYVARYTGTALNATWGRAIYGGDDGDHRMTIFGNVATSEPAGDWDVDIPFVFDKNAVEINSRVTSVAGDTGTYTWSQPFVGRSYKKVIIKLASYVQDTTSAITFEVAFSATPVVTANSTGLTIDTISATSVTIPASTPGASSGFIVIEGY